MRLGEDWGAGCCNALARAVVRDGTLLPHRAMDVLDTLLSSVQRCSKVLPDIRTGASLLHHS
jgi:hypothetical protein